MSSREQLFTEARNKGHLVCVSHDTKRSGYRNRSYAKVSKVAKDYVVLQLDNGYRTVRYDSIYCISTHP